jgi:DNA-binding transcriptional ArsR family regulator
MTQREPESPKDCAELLAALASEERLKIVRFLQAGPRNVTEIADMLKTSPVNVAHHMGVLKMAGLVRNRKQGRFVFYSLVPGLYQTADQPNPCDVFDLGCCRLQMPCTDAPPQAKP